MQEERVKFYIGVFGLALFIATVAVTVLNQQQISADEQVIYDQYPELRYQ